jgi:hypothetical protein
MFKRKSDGEICCVLLKAEVNSPVAKWPTADILPGQVQCPVTGDEYAEDMELRSLINFPMKQDGKPAPLLSYVHYEVTLGKSRSWTISTQSSDFISNYFI